MFQKDMRFAYLADFYGELLDEHTRAVIIAYYDDDLSLSEIADGEGISRQGVRHIIKKGEEQLDAFESRIGLARRHEELSALTEKLSSEAKALLSSEDENVRAAGERILAVAAEIDKK
jgi:predicted DNA-binding protein YlxM (UPF0122 family)